MIRRSTYLSAVGAALLAGLTLVVAASAAFAEKRVALIVGNSTYQNVPQLPNPSRDANSVAKMFRDAGFETVDVQLDVGNLEFKRSIRKFEMAADQRVHRHPRSKFLPLTHYVFSAAHDVLGEEQRDWPAIRPRTVTR